MYAASEKEGATKLATSVCSKQEYEGFQAQQVLQLVIAPSTLRGVFFKCFTIILRYCNRFFLFL